MMVKNIKHKLLVLAGRPIGTVEIVRYAKSKGAYVIVCDYLPDVKSPAKLIADECWHYSTAEVDLITEKARNCGVTAVLSGSHEFNIMRAIEVCEKLKLPFFCTRQQWDMCQNKIKFKELCSKFNVPIPESYEFDKNRVTLDESNIKLPVIVKPSDSSASRGISVCHNINDLAPAIEIALDNSVEKKYVVEKFMTSDEIMIYYTIQDGNSHLTGICKRFTNCSYGGDTPLPEFYYFDKNYIPLYEKEINNNVQRMFDSIGLKNGVALIQAFLSKQSFYVFEMSLRINASQEYNLTSALLGFNPLEMLVDYSLTGLFGIRNITNCVDPYWGGKYVCILPIVLNVGKVKIINGIDLIKKNKNVIAVTVFGGDEEEITEKMFGSMNQVFIRIYIAAESKNEMINTVRYVSKTVQVRDKYDNNMVLFEFDASVIQ